MVLVGLSSLLPSLRMLSGAGARATSEAMAARTKVRPYRLKDLGGVPNVTY